MNRAVVGITGASGSAYAVRFVGELLRRGWFVHVVCTDSGRRVLMREAGLDAGGWCGALRSEYGGVALEDAGDLLSPVASGSFRVDAVVVIPCSMATLGEIAGGAGKGLLCRAADVALKEGRKLLLVPRETPLNAIHLENMLKLCRLGAGMLPAMPGFYHRPGSVDGLVDFVVGKALDWLGIDNDLFARWGAGE